MFSSPPISPLDLVTLVLLSIRGFLVQSSVLSLNYTPFRSLPIPTHLHLRHATVTPSPSALSKSTFLCCRSSAHDRKACSNIPTRPMSSLPVARHPRKTGSYNQIKQYAAVHKAVVAVDEAAALTNSPIGEPEFARRQHYNHMIHRTGACAPDLLRPTLPDYKHARIARLFSRNNCYTQNHPRPSLGVSPQEC